MKLSAREHMGIGKTYEERMGFLVEAGYDAIEITGRSDILEVVEEITAVSKTTGCAVSTICSGARGALLDSQRDQRELALSDLKNLLKAAAELDAVGVIYAPLIAVKMNPDQHVRIPDLRPMMSQQKLEMELLVALASELAQYAADLGVCMLWEPLNRYEQWWFNRLENGAELCDRVDSEGCKVLADFFHMSIEEDNITESLRKFGEKYVRHVHLADSNRATPGHGHTDFAGPFAVLKEVGFDGYMALECSPRGDKAEDLKRCAEFLRSMM